MRLPDTLDKAFVPKSCPMFSNLIAKLGDDGTLTPQRVRDMISGLRGVARALGRPPEDVPVDPTWLQPRLAGVAPAALGLTPKTWSNVLSNAKAAMVHFGLLERRLNRLADISPEWRRLWAIVLSSRGPTLHTSLCRFIYFLNRLGVAPNDVREVHAEAFKDALARNEISRSPDVAQRLAVNGWNLAIRRIPEWPRTRLSLPSRRKLIRLPMDAFPASFRDDLDRLVDRLRHPDPLDPSGRRNPLRTKTIEQYRRQLMQFASELVNAKVPIDEIDRVNVLIQPAMAELGLRQMLSRNANQSRRGIAEMASLLCNLGKRIGASEEALKQLGRLADRVAVPKQKGMTRKNRDRLRVLQDDGSLRKLLLLPERLLGRPRGKSKPYSTALAREDALAVAILLICPIRVENLAEIHLERNLQRPGDGRLFLVFEDDEIKNKRPVEFELPPELRRMIDQHLGSRTPLLCPPGTPWLFPRRDGRGAVASNQLSYRLTRRIRKEAGLVVNAHLFRHLAVMLWLDANPGGYEAAKRLLGHSALSHTLNMYSGLEVSSATRAYARLVSDMKGPRP